MQAPQREAGRCCAGGTWAATYALGAIAATFLPRARGWCFLRGMDSPEILAALERVRRGGNVSPVAKACLCHASWPDLVCRGALTDAGRAALLARPIPEAELGLLRAAARGEGRRVAKAHERPTLAALVAWGLVADSNGAKIVVTAWGADVLAHHDGGATT